MWPDCNFGNNGVNSPNLNNSVCNTQLNNEGCGYDGGDCCTRTCIDTAIQSCSRSDFYCVDPDNLATPAPTTPVLITPAPTAVLVWPDCDLGGSPASAVGDSHCDVLLNNEPCGYDGGDCCSASCVSRGGAACSESDGNCVDPDHTMWPDCNFGDNGLQPPANLNNSVCNTQLNNAGCGYDGGDCCTRTCIDTAIQSCSRSDFYCVDPENLATPAPTTPVLITPAPTAVLVWPNCDLGGSPASAVGDSHCDVLLNNEPCGFDGGDCCAATCLQRDFNDCADGNTYCLDERYRYDCDFGSLSEFDLADGYCDTKLNTVPCNYDGGDCCLFSCVSSSLHKCSRSEADYPDCKQEAQEEERDDDFSQGFAQGQARVLPAATVLALGLGIVRNFRRQ